jgi:glutamyl-tRNA synthetase
LFNYLLARRTKGQFLLRIEDTDAKRTVPGAEEQLYRDLRWAGLQWDEGPEVGGPYGPYRQSERLPLYKKHVQTLLDTGNAYRCFCTADRIAGLYKRRHEKGLSLGYDRKCHDLLSSAECEERAHRGEAHVIRFLSPPTWPRYTDLTYGKDQGHGEQRSKRLLVADPVYEDSILMKSDGFPTYHLANVVDDHEMQITHVIRGSEWMASTPLHIAMYQSFGWKPPAFAHVPLLVDENKQKLSKRNFDSDISSFRDKGILPEALTNFAVLLGWSHSLKADTMDLAQLEEQFDLKITKGNTLVDMKKLDFLQEAHARRRTQAGGEGFDQMVRDVAVALLDRYGARQVMRLLNPVGSEDPPRKLENIVEPMLRIKSLKYRSASQFAEECALFFEPQDLDSAVAPEDLGVYQPNALRVAASTLALIPPSEWKEATLHEHLSALEAATPTSAVGESPSSPPPEAALKDEARDRTHWKIRLHEYLRWALCGRTRSPGTAAMLDIFGRHGSIQRIQAANVRLRELEVSKTKPVLKAEGFRGTVDGKRRIEKSWTPHSL